jgi:hypothetical protein
MRATSVTVENQRREKKNCQRFRGKLFLFAVRWYLIRGAVEVSHTQVMSW